MNYYTIEELTQVTPALEEFIQECKLLGWKNNSSPKNYVGSGAWKKVCGMLHIQKIKL